MLFRSGESLWAGKTLLDLNLGNKYGVHVASILRGKRRINIPGGRVRLFPMDKIQVIGTDQQLSLFGEEMSRGSSFDTDVFERWVGGSTLGSYFVSCTSSHYDWAIKKLKAHIKNCKA